MLLTSPVFINGEQIPREYTGDAGGQNPPLQITAAPANAKSLVIIVDDPDAPAGTWTHWLLWNIPSTTTMIVSGMVPPGAIEGQNSGGTIGWEPPYPPSGTHRYFFTVYALDTMLELKPGSSTEALETALEGHVLEQSKLMGTYSQVG